MKNFISIILCVLTFNSFACIDGDTLLPSNAKMIYSGEKSNISESEFNKLILDITNIYTPLMKQMGLTLKSYGNWKNPQVNARADRKGRARRIIIYGGIARHELVTHDELALVICHEIGHHIGGAPKASAWATGEGQADYFAAMKCARRYFLNFPKLLDSNTVAPSIVKDCQSSFASEEDIQVCMRTHIAGLNLAKLFSTLNSTQAPNINSRDENVVSRTNHRHPLPQCRYDTYASGSICPVNYSVDFSSRDETLGACHVLNGDSIGIRPRCWFKPRN